MLRNKTLSLAAVLAAGALGACAQVLAPAEIRDPKLRALQQQHLPVLEQAAAAISRHQFPYPFFTSRKLDLTETQQRASDQRSVRFDSFHDKTVLEITGNYYASYSAAAIGKEDRARRTLLDVVVPIVEAIAPGVKDETAMEGIAVEISQHVRRNMLNVGVEGVEHIAFLLPRSLIPVFLAATTPEGKEAALHGGALYVNAEPAPGWENQAELWAAATPRTEAATSAAGTRPDSRGVSAERLRDAQATYQSALDKLVRDLDKDAHFVSYAQPSFIPFRDGAYLQLSVSTTLAEKGGSRYRIAALAFDEHIAHLIRPVLGALPDRSRLDGIDFSTSVRGAGEAASALSVEFLFPVKALACYEKYDCTGQQLIDQGFVLINGERVSLSLQTAEAER